VGLEPVKINTVVIRGYNDNEILDFARKSLEGWHVRFIEYMPIGEGMTDKGSMSPKRSGRLSKRTLLLLRPGIP